VFARQEEVPLRSLSVGISGELDLEDPVRDDVTVFRRVELEFALAGPSAQQAELLVKRFKGR